MKRVKLLLPVVLMMLGLAACSGDSAQDEFLEVQDYSQEEEGKQIKIENAGYTFTMDADTTQFSIVNKQNGQTWYSNPQDLDTNETIANGTNKDMLSATLYVKYSDAKGQSFAYDNYSYSIKDKRYSFEEIKNESGVVVGVKVLYTVGDVQKTYLLPTAITEDRMEDFCSKMEDKDAKMIKNVYRRIDINNLRATDNKDQLLEQYPDLAETKVYVIRSGQSDTKLAAFQEMFESAGYTYEEYEYDNSRINVSQSTGKAAYNIPVYYTLEEDGLVVDIPMEEIVYDKKYPITYLTPLPFFGAAGKEETGYLFVPDGSGGIINFNNGKVNQAAYYNQLYGADLAITREAIVDESEVSYPLIGMAKSDGSYLCAIEEGSSYAIVEGDVSGRFNSYNSVKFTYTMLHGENMDISGKSDVTVRTYERSLPKEHLKQRYLFLDTDNYVDMATAYREYLMRTYSDSLGDKTEEGVSVVVDFIGGVDSKDHVMGVPVTKDLPLTKFEDAEAITSDLVASGIENMTVKYSGWSNGGIHGSTTQKVKLSKKLGGKKDLKSFVDTAKNAGVEVFMDSNYQLVYKNGLFDKYSVNRDTCKYVSREIVEIPYYSPIYFSEMEEEYTYYLARPVIAMKSVDSVYNYVKNIGVDNISLGDISSELSADYNYKKHVSREAMMNMITEKYKELAGNGAKVMASSDYFYNIPYADVVTNMVLSNKSFNIVDETIPFYQIALHGIVNYTAESLNLSQNAEETFLKSAELGANLYYTLTEESAQILQDTKYTEYFATEYDLWKDTIVENYTRFAKDFSGIGDEYITGHEKIAEDVYATEYSDGTRVIVNYNFDSFDYNGTEIPARDYVVEGGNN
ncbi:MAG: hypothetical protein E7267_06050 [Lachnospiraceae bacterium]|nr:hypothetical protein [Lachnospiraceae bacterium]